MLLFICRKIQYAGQKLEKRFNPFMVNVDMKRRHFALSIVAPNGSRIAHGIKTLEVRSWTPEQLPLKDVVIVENQHYLNHNGDEEQGVAVAVADILAAHPWRKDEFEAACATYWAEGYFAWVLDNVRPIDPPIAVPARRKIYLIEIDHP